MTTGVLIATLTETSTFILDAYIYKGLLEQEIMGYCNNNAANSPTVYA